MQGVFFYSFFVCCAINYHKISGFKHSDGHTPLQIAWKNVPLALLPQQWDVESGGGGPVVTWLACVCAGTALSHGVAASSAGIRV